MACACGKKSNTPASPKSYTVTWKENGQTQTKSYRTEVEAAAAAQRVGGTVKAG